MVTDTESQNLCGQMARLSDADDLASLISWKSSYYWMQSPHGRLLCESAFRYHKHGQSALGDSVDTRVVASPLTAS